MSFKIGIVGLPNVGKSSLFQILTKQAVDVANYPFATIDPNVGIVAVPDERLSTLSTMSASVKTTPTTVEFVDIAGLVKGAHQGEGLGNKFLANIREVDAIAQVVRAFEDPNVIHVAGDVNPTSDMETIAIELAMSDLATVERRKDILEKQKKAGLSKESEAELAIVTKVFTQVADGKAARDLELSADEHFVLRPLNLLTLKPILYVVNVSESQVASATAKDFGLPADQTVIIAVKVEQELVDLPMDEASAYLKELGLPESGLDRLIKTAYRTLGLITYLTTGPEESRAWTIPAGTKAPQAAGVIHTDFEKAFIRVEVVSYEELVAAGSWEQAKPAGKLRIEGKDYVMQDGDVVFFRVGA